MSLSFGDVFLHSYSIRFRRQASSRDDVDDENRFTVISPLDSILQNACALVSPFVHPSGCGVSATESAETRPAGSVLLMLLFRLRGGHDLLTCSCQPTTRMHGMALPVADRTLHIAGDSSSDYADREHLPLFVAHLLMRQPGGTLVSYFFSRHFSLILPSPKNNI